MNVARHVERARAERPDAIALRFDDCSTTYAALDDRAGRLASALAGMGLQRGERMGLFLPNGPAFVVAYLAVQKLGAIAVSLNAFWKRGEVTRAVLACGARFMLTDRELVAQIDTDALPGLSTVLTSDALDALIAGAAASMDAIDVPADQPSAIVFSSGTTAEPKGCTLSHGNVVSNIEAKVTHLAITPEDRLLLFVPLFHCFGQNAVLNAAFQGGATVILERGFTVERTLATIASERPTMFFGVPPVFAMLLDRARPADLKPLRYYFSAAAPLPASVALQWHERHGHPIHEGYGLTETSPFATYNHVSRYRPGSIGTPITGVSLRVVDPATGEELGPRQVGEIAISGPNVMLGYWQRPDETSLVIRDGWFYSGDLGYRDEDGYYFLVDRLKDMINVGGLKVSPVEVEQTLLEHPAVSRAGVFSMADPLFGEQVAACVVLNAPGEATAAALIGFCRERLAFYKAPVRIVFRGSLPVSPAGKLLRRQLPALLEADHS
jgi:long-chain acyl-CoA synthetase